MDRNMNGEIDNTIEKTTKENWRKQLWCGIDYITSWYFRPRVKEMPERTTIHYTTVYSATDENTINKLCYLHTQQWLGNALVVQYTIHQKELTMSGTYMGSRISATVRSSTTTCTNWAPRLLQSRKKEIVLSSLFSTMTNRPARG